MGSTALKSAQAAWLAARRCAAHPPLPTCRPPSCRASAIAAADEELHRSERRQAGGEVARLSIVTTRAVRGSIGRHFLLGTRTLAVRRSSGAEQGEVPACTQGGGAGLWTACTTLTSIAQEEVCLEGLSGMYRRARPQAL